jgi:hypothetical protein
MNKEFAERWVADLRDPNNKQCTSVLHDGVGYCCLGRAVVIGGFKLVPRRVEVEGDDIETRKDEFVLDGTQDDEGIGGEYEALEARTMETLGFSGPQGEPKDGTLTIAGRIFKSLAEANDEGITFAQIADWVEKNWERL